MKQKKCIAGIYLLGALAAQAGNYTVKSPDGKLAVNVSCEGGRYHHRITGCLKKRNACCQA